MTLSEISRRTRINHYFGATKLGGPPAPPESEKLTEIYASKSRSLPEE